MILAATIALVLAILFDYLGLGNRAFGDRAAAFCASFAFSYFFLDTPIAHWMQVSGVKLQAQAQRALTPRMGPKVGEAIGAYGLGMLVLVLFAVWVGALWPKRILNGHTGQITQREMNSWLIWIPAAVLPLLSGFVPGAIGTFVRFVIGLSVQAGYGIGYLFAHGLAA